MGETLPLTITYYYKTLNQGEVEAEIFRISETRFLQSKEEGITLSEENNLFLSELCLVQYKLPTTSFFEIPDEIV